MLIIMGAFGHVGSEVVKALLRDEQDVIVVTHDPGHAWRWEGTGAEVALADVIDPDAMRVVFRQGRRAVVTPREPWEASFRGLGFSQAAAESYARMTGATLDGLDLPEVSIKGRVTIDEYVRDLVEATRPSA
jgi:uncharacterized protein YbjT (DUF2867 family)